MSSLVFLDRFLNQGNAPLLERMVRFTGARQAVIAENIANVDTPGYRQKNLSLPAFQRALQERIERRDKSASGSTTFDDLSGQVSNPRSGLLFHDRNNRSMEQLMSDMASNALKHNMYTEMLRKQFDTMAMVLKERVA